MDGADVSHHADPLPLSPGGFDTDWIDAGATRQAAYTNLPPGDYQFHVKSDNGGGDWSPEETTIAVSMLPRFYQTLWFYVGVGVVARG